LMTAAHASTSARLIVFSGFEPSVGRMFTSTAVDDPSAPRRPHPPQPGTRVLAERRTGSRRVHVDGSSR
jgi:hypothetical protein